MSGSSAKSWVDNFMFEWIGNDAFLATMPPVEGITRQGTYLYTLSTGVSKKLSSYVMRNCVTLQQAGYAVFTTINGFLFKYKIDTQELTQMINTVENRHVLAFLSKTNPQKEQLPLPVEKQVNPASGLSNSILQLKDGITQFPNSDMSIFGIEGSVNLLPPTSDPLLTRIAFFFKTNAGGGLEELQFTKKGSELLVYSKVLNQKGKAFISPTELKVIWERGGMNATDTVYRLNP
jgi:hypothetical protein